MRLKYLLWNSVLFLVLLLAALKRHDDTPTSSTSCISFVNMGDARAGCFSANADAVGRKRIKMHFLMPYDERDMMCLHNQASVQYYLFAEQMEKMWRASWWREAFAFFCCRSYAILF
ncbi:hypothetical protein K438DRAFT_1749671 [Mycena galopus ATCC 62051]|nr:hypothetical protein K438DRAFT_1749671 [Mycena galopus ATCC 62051]